MLPLDLDAIEARANAATPGPWEFSAHQPSLRTGDWDVFEDEHGVYPPLGESGPVAMCRGETLASFIAHAREDVPALVAEARRWPDALREKLKRLEQLYEAGAPYESSKGLWPAMIAVLAAWRDMDPKYLPDDSPAGIGDDDLWRAEAEHLSANALTEQLPAITEAGDGTSRLSG